MNDEQCKDQGQKTTKKNELNSGNLVNKPTLWLISRFPTCNILFHLYVPLSYIGVKNSRTAVQDTSIFFAFLTSEKLCACWNSCSMLRITI